jgi:Zn-dependent protease
MITDPDTIIRIISVAVIPLIFAITLHEAAHGWVASKLGDTTALMLGRVSLNPVKHIDPIGTIVLPSILMILGGFIFGWAKPVPVNWRNLNNPRRDMALVAIAGPAANLLMAFTWAAIAKISLHAGHGNIVWLNNAMNFTQQASLFGIRINVILMVLNLLPIPPLDGSRIISAILPPAAAITYEKIEPYGIWILLALIFLGMLHLILYPPVMMTIIFIVKLFGLR